MKTVKILFLLLCSVAFFILGCTQVAPAENKKLPVSELGKEWQRLNDSIENAKAINAVKSSDPALHNLKYSELGHQIYSCPKGSFIDIHSDMYILEIDSCKFVAWTNGQGLNLLPLRK